MTYDVRIEAESAPQPKGFEKTLLIGFSGRLGKGSGERITWAVKSFKAKE